MAENELKVSRSLRLRGLGLEVGVGSGRFASRLNVPIGIDPSISMLKLAHKRGIKAIRAVGEKLPFRSNAFDYALLIVTLCFVDDPSEVIAEVARVVKPSGLVVSCIIPRDSVWGHYYMKLGEQGHPFYRIAKFYTIDEVEKLLVKANLKIKGHYATCLLSHGTNP
ncbi:MAG: class I SAM-dependent methyltransferase [Candidatus Nezhaarchaeales archaeon]